LTQGLEIALTGKAFSDPAVEYRTMAAYLTLMGDTAEWPSIDWKINLSLALPASSCPACLGCSFGAPGEKS